jgi:hypothetical protein
LKRQAAQAQAVLDSWAIPALVLGETSTALVVRRHLRRARTGNTRLLLDIVNLVEVYYRTWQLLGEARSEEIWSLVHGLPVDVVLVKEPLAREAARVKAQESALSGGCLRGRDGAAPLGADPDR